MPFVGLFLVRYIPHALLYGGIALKVMARSSRPSAAAILACLAAIVVTSGAALYGAGLVFGMEAVLEPADRNLVWTELMIPVIPAIGFAWLTTFIAEQDPDKDHSEPS